MPNKSTFFPFRVDPFSKGIWCAGEQTGSHNSCLPCTKWQKIYKVYPVQLSKSVISIICKMPRFCHPAQLQSYQDHCPQLFLSSWPSDSVKRWWKPWSDCADMHFKVYTLQRHCLLTLKALIKIVADILIFFYYHHQYFYEKIRRHFRWNTSKADDPHDISNLIFSEQFNKNQTVLCCSYN